MLFVVVNEGIELPEPLAASPMPGLLFIQVKVVPVTVPVNGVTGAITVGQ